MKDCLMEVIDTCC